MYNLIMLIKSLRLLNSHAQRSLIARRSFIFGSKQVDPMQNVSTAAPKRIAITGAAGNIAYSILFRIASG